MADTKPHPQVDGLPHPLGSYIHAGALGMFLWDVIIHLEEEYRLLLKQKITFPTIVYLLCRSSVLCSAVVGTMFFTAPLDEWCFVVAKIMVSGFAAIMVTSSLLLVLFIRAFYAGNSRFSTVFTVTSFFVVIGSSAIPPYLAVGRTASFTSPYCTIAYQNKRLSQVLILTMAMHRLTVFWAIGKKLLPANSEDGPRSLTKAMKIRRILEGRHLPELSRTLWRDGQKYSLAFILAGLTMFIVHSTDVLPEGYGFILSSVLTIVHNCTMSLLVRRIKAVSLDPERNMDITSISDSDHLGNGLGYAT